jgi:NAD(P)-dependent dehydrogenase (short-subunit alcohol dehydrogenase family)
MDDKIAIVTGGRRGIGRGVCEALARSGWHLAIVDLERDASAEATIAAIESLGRQVVFVVADIGNLETHGRILEAADRLPGRLDALVNNAGVSSLVRGDMLEVSPESFDRCLVVNIRASFFLTQLFAKRLAENVEPRFRCVVNISSANVEIVAVDRADYCVSKAAIPMMTQLFAARLAAQRINVYEVRPGMIMTEMTAPAKAKYDAFVAAGGLPIARWGQPEDIGKAVAMLANGGLNYSTGDVIRVDGGLHMYRVGG